MTPAPYSTSATHPSRIPNAQSKSPSEITGGGVGVRVRSLPRVTLKLTAGFEARG